MGDQRAFRRGICRWVDQRLDCDAGVLTAPANLSLFITQTTPGHPKFNCTFQIMTPSYCIPLHFCINNSALSLMFRDRRRPRRGRDWNGGGGGDRRSRGAIKGGRKWEPLTAGLHWNQSLMFDRESARRRAWAKATSLASSGRNRVFGN